MGKKLSVFGKFLICFWVKFFNLRKTFIIQNRLVDFNSIFLSKKIFHEELYTYKNFFINLKISD